MIVYVKGHFYKSTMDILKMQLKMSFTLTLDNIKYLGIKPVKDVQDPTLSYTEGMLLSIYPFHFDLVTSTSIWAHRNFIYHSVTYGERPVMVPMYLPGMDAGNWNMRQFDYRGSMTLGVKDFFIILSFKNLSTIIYFLF